METVLSLALQPLRRQLMLIMVALATVLVLSYTTLVYQLEKTRYLNDSVTEIGIISDALAHDYAGVIISNHSAPVLSEELKRKWLAFPMIIHANLENSLDESILHYSHSDEEEEVINLKNLKDPLIANDLLFYKQPVMEAGEQVGRINYIVSIDKYKQLMKQLLVVLLLTTPVVLILVIVLSIWLQTIITRPLRRLVTDVINVTESENYQQGLLIKAGDKSEFTTLAKVFNVLLDKVYHTLEELEVTKARAMELAYYDELTGLPNRRLLMERIKHILGIAKREKKYGSLFFIDIDNFKVLNDSLGHNVGDELLKQVANGLKEVFRSEDTVARLGGDEFVILSGYLDESEEAVVNQNTILIHRLRRVLHEKFNAFGDGYQLTASIGISSFPGMASSVTMLIKQADIAMYKAKERGRDGFCFYQKEMQAVADSRLQIEQDLRSATLNDEFELFYQPQVDEFGRILSVEALLRWPKKDSSFNSPDVFIPVAEQTGLVVPIGEWVLKKGLQQSRQWMLNGANPNFRLSINVSPFQFYQDDFVDNVKRALKETGASATAITLEVTEGIAIKDVESIIEKMNELTHLGFKIAMDDFGTGYSSLTYLKRLPLSELKIDRSFVRDVLSDESDREIAVTIIAMAKSLKLNVVAEGVEEEGQLRFLHKNGCRTFQGYYFYKPMPVGEVTKLLFGGSCHFINYYLERCLIRMKIIMTMTKLNRATGQ